MAARGRGVALKVPGSLAALLVCAAAAAGWYAMLPPPTLSLPDAAGSVPPVRGAIHVHTRRSDGAGTVEEVAAAAARAGLRFVIVTDHGDATREPSRPAYRDGVLCIDGVEISTNGGHVVALGMPPAPYPLGGEARDVVEDIARLGGFSIAAHPGSAKPELRWSDWSLPVDGVEWLNGDSEWRDETMVSLVSALFTYPIRATETLTALVDRPEVVLQRWDEQTRRRRVVAVAAADAHARIGLRGASDPYQDAATLRVPSYEQIFRAFSIALPQVRLTGNAETDARAVLDEIRAGHVYSTLDGLASPGRLTFVAMRDEHAAAPGDALSGAGPVALRVDANAPPGSGIRIIENGKVLTAGPGPHLEHTVPGEEAVYRVEVYLPAAPGDPPPPWLVSNPIYVGGTSSAAPADPPRAAATTFASVASGGAAPWTIEKSERAAAALDTARAVGGSQLLLRYGLGGSVSDSPYVAWVLPAGGAVAGYDRLVFTANADKPTRLSVQLRAVEGEAEQRWRRSVYLDETPRRITVFFDDMVPAGDGAADRPVLDAVRHLLLVVDTVNTALGSSGQIWVDDLRYAR